MDAEKVDVDGNANDQSTGSQVGRERGGAAVWEMWGEGWVGVGV